ncbi:hypothetical protein SO802_030938 [Lithocarpus litseifolius]|uniref:Protein FAR1-RELATED SEQUENCE n=1 Tax=Lithocarpus litseifolius TaxID=425828 RepID=A0AAW2BLD5_9ROSI
MWAVIAVVIVFEFTVGATLSKGLNRACATVSAGALGCGAHHLARLFGAKGEPIVLGLLVFLLAAGSSFTRFIPRIKARYDYVVLIFILTFSLVSVTGYRVDKILELANERLMTIGIGGAICIIVSICVCPVWAGEDLHKLVASNIEKLASSLEGFGGEYFPDPEDHEGNVMASKGDKALLQGYKSVLNSKNTEESSANFARWEPGHGRFYFRHPWKQYLKIGVLARQCAYRIDALNGYINSDLQIHHHDSFYAAMEFRNKIRKPSKKMCSEASEALKALALSIKTMTDTSAAKSHVENSKTAIDELKLVLKAVSLENADLLAIIPIASVASILTEITKCVENIYESVHKLSCLAEFKTPKLQAPSSTPIHEPSSKLQAPSSKLHSDPRNKLQHSDPRTKLHSKLQAPSSKLHSDPSSPATNRPLHRPILHRPRSRPFTGRSTIQIFTGRSSSPTDPPGSLSVLVYVWVETFDLFSIGKEKEILGFVIYVVEVLVKMRDLLKVEPNGYLQFKDIEEIEDCLIVERLENSDDNLLDKVAYIEVETYHLYNNYALQTSFSIRKGKPRYFNGTKNIRQNEFLCSKEGFKIDEDPCEEKNWEKLETRTGCKAFICFTVENDVWRVTAFNPKHNHELALPSEKHLLRSGCRISKPKAGLIDSMVNAGISTKNTYLYLTEEVGGSENVGFTKKYCYNHVNTKKMSTISAGDAQSLLNHFKKRQIEDHMFFYTVQVDQETRMNFFWRDGRSKVDYDCFGDVVVFDTTYRTNRYNLICAPFVGVNHHWQDVIFGCAFLLDETTTSFKWLFKSFLDSMGNRSPITIFTNQDQAMSNAIEEVFSNTHH